MLGQTGRLRNRLLTAAAVAVVFVALALLNNNLSTSRTTRERFEERLDLAIENGLRWVDARRRSISVSQPNSALLHMIRDMADQSNDPRLRQIVERFLASRADSPWARLVDQDASFRPPEPEYVAKLGGYQRWILHALYPANVPLADHDRADMFSPSKHHWGSLTHQLLAVYVWRRGGRGSKEIDELIDTLCQRIATEAALDVRVSDLYLQRVAFILAAGRPDLVRRRWVERMVAHQHSDGGWNPSWHGWGPGAFQFRPGCCKPDAHASIQGLWALMMLKHRYPEWIDDEFPAAAP